MGGPNLQFLKGPDEPPPYSHENDRIARSTDEQGISPLIPDGRWDLACSIDVHDGFLQLNHRSEPTWTQNVRAETLTNRVYQRDGFSITLGQPHIQVNNRAYNWVCDANTAAGELLTSKRDTISLRSLGERLLVFERTIVTKDQDRPPRKPRGDPKGCLKFESQCSNIWTITGTDIYQVEGSEHDVVVRSPEFLRLWDMAKGRFRWERKSGGGRIWGITKDYIIREIGNYHLHERRNGNVYGNFRLPSHRAFIDLNKDNHFGPVVSPSGLFLYKPCRKAIFIFRIRDRRVVDVRIWESADDIKGHLVLRGSLENLELEIIGKNPLWTKYEETEPIYKNDFIKKRIL